MFSILIAPRYSSISILFFSLRDKLSTLGSLCADQITGIAYPADVDDESAIIVPVSVLVENSTSVGIFAGITFPSYWKYFPPPHEVLWKIHRLGYLRAAEFMLTKPCVYSIRP